MIGYQKSVSDGDRLCKVNDLSNAVFCELYIPSGSLVYITSSTSDNVNTPTKTPLDTTYNISLKRAPFEQGPHDPQQEITKAELSTCFNIIERTSRKDYEASAWGWHPKRKRNEMREVDMRYLLVRRCGNAHKAMAIEKDKEAPQSGAVNADTVPSHSEKEYKKLDDGIGESDCVSEAVAEQATPSSAASPRTSDAEEETEETPDETPNKTPDKTDILGFMSFMLTREEGQKVIYIYEIHLLEEIRRQGLAGHLFNVVEHIGTLTGMQKAMLTVFRSNRHARELYGRRGYKVDECSPEPKRLRGGVVKEVDYVIMSKRLKRKIQIESTEPQFKNVELKKRKQFERED